MESATDGELMARVRTGDRDAFADLIDRHKHMLVNYLTRLTSNRDRAEEYAQEAFLRLYQSASRYREQGQLLPYLYRIATNLVRSDERKKRRWQFLSSVFSSNGRHSETNPQSRLLAAEAKEQLQLLVQQGQAFVPPPRPAPKADGQ